MSPSSLEVIKGQKRIKKEEKALVNVGKVHMVDRRVTLEMRDLDCHIQVEEVLDE